MGIGASLAVRGTKRRPRNVSPSAELPRHPVRPVPLHQRGIASDTELQRDGVRTRQIRRVGVDDDGVRFGLGTGSSDWKGASSKRGPEEGFFRAVKDARWPTRRWLMACTYCLSGLGSW